MDPLSGLPSVPTPEALLPGGTQAHQVQAKLERAGRVSVQEAAQEFEGYFLAYLMGVMRETVPDGPFDSKAAKAFYSFYDAEIGRMAARSGGVGLAKSLEGVLQAHALENREISSLKLSPQVADTADGIVKGVAEIKPPVLSSPARRGARDGNF